MIRYVDCIDAGSDYCPCTLAEKKECIICPRLQDGDVCDCLNWKGTCINQDFINNGYKSKKTRQFVKCNVVSKEFLREDLLQLEIKVSARMARELDNLGAYVFLKREADIDAYSTPISILKSDINNNIITVVIKILGVKTKAFLEIKDEIMVKGPYWNGIQGQKYLKNLKEDGCLILARGIASVPAVLEANKIAEKGGKVYVLLDRGRSSEHFTGKYFKESGAVVENIHFYDASGNFSEETRGKIMTLMEKYNFKVVLSAGSDSFHTKAITYMYNLNRKLNFAVVSNSIMCCGEGVCGSCEIYNNKGERIKSCKQQYNPVEVFLKEMGN